MRVFKPSRVMRWPLHGLNVLLFLVVACLWGSVAIFRKLDQEPMWSLVAIGSAVCLVFIAFNLALTGMRLRLEEDGATLKVWMWRRRAPWTGMVVTKEIRPVGLTAVRLSGPDGGKGIYLNPSWFVDFDSAVATMEEKALAASGEVREVSP